MGTIATVVVGTVSGRFAGALEAVRGVMREGNVVGTVETRAAEEAAEPTLAFKLRRGELGEFKRAFRAAIEAGLARRDEGEEEEEGGGGPIPATRGLAGGG